MSRFKRRSSTKPSNNPVVIKNNGNNNGRNGKLTPKQEKFVDEYLKDLNATKAAIRAGYSRRSANNIGPGNLLKPIIQQAIQERRDELKASTQMDQEWVLERYKRLIEYHIDDFYDDEGNLRPLSEIPKDALYAICGFKNAKHSEIIKYKTGTVKKVNSLLQKFKMPNKKDVLDSIGKYLGMFEKDNEQKRPIVPVQINVRLVD